MYVPSRVPSRLAFGVNKSFFFISEFPSVTICNQNLYRESVMKRADPLAAQLVRLSYPLNVGPTLNRSEILSDPVIVERLQRFNATQLALDNVQPIEEMLIECKFRGFEINCSENFSPIITAFGWCYIFNSYERVTTLGSYETYSTGSAQGLYLRMNVNQSEYFFGPNLSAGFKVKSNVIFRYIFWHSF